MAVTEPGDTETEVEKDEKCGWEILTLRHGLHGNASEKLKIEERRGRAKCRG